MFAGPRVLHVVGGRTDGAQIIEADTVKKRYAELSTAHQNSTLHTTARRTILSSAGLHFFQNISQVVNDLRVTQLKFPETSDNQPDQGICSGPAISLTRSQGGGPPDPPVRAEVGPMLIEDKWTERR